MIGPAELWLIIAGLAIGSYFLRFAFIGIVGDRPLPEWLLRHLRYTAVAILPALVAPKVVWPDATGGDPDPLRMTAALVTVVVGFMTRNVLAAISSGAATLYALLFIIG